MQLDKFVLVGHSFGGFLSMAYSLKYPKHCAHVVCVDPWGFPENLDDNDTQVPLRPPRWVRMVATVLKPFNPLASLRAAGPLGPQMIHRFRPDLMRKFEDTLSDPSIINEYMYHCNAQYPSGESAFKNMAIPFGWAKNPMVNRAAGLHENVSVSFYYGARSWIDPKPANEIQAIRGEEKVEIKIFEGSGHHVYADRAEEFNIELVKLVGKVKQNVAPKDEDGKENDGE